MKLTTKLILPAVLIFALSLTGCPQAGTNPGENSGTNPAVPSNPNELVESDVLTAFGLHRGSITASAAAKKIVTGAPSGGITFTQKAAVSYDDEAGTFTVKVKGTKNGKPFDKTLSLTGFTHPLKDKLIQSLDAFELNLDDAIEHNYSLEKYITEVNKDPSGKKLVKKLSFLLNDGTTPIELGEHDGYTLTAKAQATGTQVWVQPKVKIVFRKLTEGGTETLTDSTPFGFTHLKTQLTKDYFTEQDVFKYILDKTADIAVKVDLKEFASSFYAFAKESGQAPANLFTKEFTDAVKKYADLYQSKDANEHLALNISYGIAQPKNGGIDADDYTGTVTIKLCIATNEQIANQNNITAIKDIKKSGFAKITTAAELNKQVFFAVISNPNPSTADVQAWKEKSFENYPLLRVDNGAVTPNPIVNPLPGGSSKPFWLCVNGTDNLASQLGCGHFGASLTRNGKSIFIENIVLNKKQNETDLKITVQLKGSDPFLTIITKPGPGY